MTTHDRVSDWSRIVRAAQWKINGGWLVERSTPLIIGVGLVAAVVILLCRSQGMDLTNSYALFAMGGCAVFAAVLVFFWARRSFESQAETLVRLESQLGMKGALVAAHDGITPWPEVPERARSGLRWRWIWLGLPLPLAILIVAAALIVPVQTNASRSNPTHQPSTWGQMDNWLEELETKEIADEEDIEKFEEQLEDLQQLPEEEWYSHSAMEASDTLKKQLGNSIQKLKQQMEQTAKEIDNLMEASAANDKEARETAMEQYSIALSGLETGSLKPNAELMEELKKLDPSQLGSLTQEQLSQLMEQLEAQAGQLPQSGQGLGEGLAGAGELQDLIDQFESNSTGEGTGLGEGPALGEGEGPGRGGISRGPGTAPITLSKSERSTGPGQIEGVGNTDLRSLRPGELLEVTNDEHEVDKSPTARQGGGSVRSLGKGGEQVWKDQLLPSEREALKRYFK